MAATPQLESLVGRWSGVWRTWVEPDVLHDQSPIEGEITPILGGRDLLYRYTATIAGDPVEGWALIGPRQGGGATVAWVDTWHTSGLVLVSHGDWVTGGLEVITGYAAGDEQWEWTSALVIEGDRLVVRHWNRGPEVPKYLGVEAVLDRA